MVQNNKKTNYGDLRKTRLIRSFVGCDDVSRLEREKLTKNEGSGIGGGGVGVDGEPGGAGGGSGAG